MAFKPRIDTIVGALALVLAGCAHTPSPTITAHADRCIGLEGLDDSALSSRLDLAPVILEKIRAATGNSPAQICAMTEPEVSGIMLAERKKYRSADRDIFRAPAKEFIGQWDLDDQGQPPNATQVLTADAARKKLLPGGASHGIGERGQTLAAGISNTQWSALGPGNVGGRVRAIVIDPRNTSRFFVAAAGGGIFVTENAGQSYKPIADFIGNIVVSALTIDPNNPNIMYAGTGESFSGALGIGMFKSTDSGVTWNFLASTSTDTAVNPLGNEWGYVNRIAVSPADSNIVLAGTARATSTAQGAVMRSTDGGNSWTRIQLTPGTVITTNPPDVVDIKIDPNNPFNVLAGSKNGHAYYSRDGGASFTRSAPMVTAATGRGGSARVELAFAKSRANVVYMSLDNGGTPTTSRGQVWKSEDGGMSWLVQSQPTHLEQQGDYDNAIWVDPTDENHVLIGGLDLYQSRDGAGSFTRVSTWQQAGPGAPQPHADHHVIVSADDFGITKPVVYFGNDGGVYRASNIFNVSANGTSSWQNLNNGLAVTQFYGGAGKRAAGGKIIGGTQDNGTLIFNSGTNWDRFAGGDGGFVAVDPQNDNTLYGEYITASIHRTVNGGTRAYICNGITEALRNTSTNTYCGNATTEEANFISPFILDPNNSSRMLVGANSLWVSNNIKDPVPSWTSIKPPVAPVVAGNRPFINAIAVADKDSNVIWTGHSLSGNTPGQVWRTTNGLSAVPSWTRAGAETLPTSTVNRITIDPDNVNRVWVVYNGFAAARVWVTNDGGVTWANIHNNLPNVTMHDIKRHPQQANWLYVAAVNGVYTSENGGQTWSTTNDGPASVRVRELFWYDPSTLIAATYGRGMFRATVASLGPANYSDMWWAGSSENGWGMSIQQHGNVQFNAIYVYDNAGKPVWYVMPAGTWNADFTVYTGPIYRPTSAPLNNYVASQFKVGAAVGSITLSFTSNSTATMQYVIDGVAGQKSIQRLVFGRGTAPLNVNDIWWGGNAQDGWGINLAQQAGIVFGTWYTYGADGKATWYAITDGTWSGTSYSGTFFSTQSAAWLGVPYDVSKLQLVPASGVTGTMRFDFSDANNATMSYQFTSGPFAGTTQSKPISRLGF